jgi:hypothetical protein
MNVFDLCHDIEARDRAKDRLARAQRRKDELLEYRLREREDAIADDMRTVAERAADDEAHEAIVVSTGRCPTPDTCKMCSGTALRGALHCRAEGCIEFATGSTMSSGYCQVHREAAHQHRLSMPMCARQGCQYRVHSDAIDVCWMHSTKTYKVQRHVAKAFFEDDDDDDQNDEA